jgi:hypothetical protein
MLLVTKCFVRIASLRVIEPVVLEIKAEVRKFYPSRWLGAIFVRGALFLAPRRT